MSFLQFELQWMLIHCDPKRAQRESCNELPPSEVQQRRQGSAQHLLWFVVLLRLMELPVFLKGSGRNAETELQKCNKHLAKQFYSLALYFLLSTLSCCPTNICWRKSCLGATLNLQTVYINCDTTHWCLDLAFRSKGIGCSHIGLPFCCFKKKKL